MRVGTDRARLATVAVVLAGLGSGSLAVTAQAEGCPNEQLRMQDAYSLRLPDCRGYEQVSPVNKGGADIQGSRGFLQTSSSGQRVDFFSLAGIPGIARGSSDFPFYFASRGSAWSSQGLLPPSPPGAFDTMLGWSEDFSKVAVVAKVGVDQHFRIYVGDTATGAFEPVTSPLSSVNNPAMAGFSADGSRVIFEDNGEELPSAAPGAVNLYEWAGAKLSLAGVLPDGSSPPAGSFAGPYNWASADTSSGGATAAYYTQNTISSDGSRVFFTAAGTGQLYVRQSGTTTTNVSASQRTVPDPNGPLPAAFMGATPDGSKVFFSSCEQLTNTSTAVSSGPGSTCESQSSNGSDLYVYDVAGGQLTDLTVDHNAGDVLGAAVQGILGSSADGSYVYFAANGVLAGGAAAGNCGGFTAEGTACSLYVWHSGAVSFIASMHEFGEALGSDAINWTPAPGLGGVAEARSARVTPDGKTLLFRSNQQLTSFENHGFNEFYRYEAVTGRLLCVSCNPTGAPPTGSATLQNMPGQAISPTFPDATILPRNLSVDGSRVFFETPDSLVPADTNGNGSCPSDISGRPSCQDVYEWEANGAGTCQRSAGCLYLISSGKSPEPSYFADASANGDNVFFFTRQALVGQDQDQLVDLYDARVGGGIAEQNPLQVVPCRGEACSGTLATPPVFGASSSATLSGAGNLTPQPEPKPAPLTRAQKLAIARKACRAKHNRHKRAICEAQARKRYRASNAKKSKRRGR